MTETGTSGKRVGTPPSAWFCGGYGGPGGTYGARLLAFSGIIGLTQYVVAAVIAMGEERGQGPM
jgi:hypothetical protein